MLTCIIFLFSTGIIAQTFSPIFRNYTTKDGLPSSQVYQLKQDSKGYIWLATENGISRFDGNSFKNYSYSNGLCVRTIFGIYEDNQERIWFYSYSGELVYYNHSDGEMHCFEFNQSLVELTKGTILNGIFIHDNTLYTFDYSGNTFKVDLMNGASTKVNGTANMNITEVGNDGIIFGHKQVDDHIICSVDFESNTGEHLIDTFSSQVGIKRSTLPSIAYTEDRQNIYTISHQGILSINRQSKSIHYKKLPNSNTQSLYLDNNGLLWLGFYDRGVFAFDPSKNDSLPTKFHYLKDYTVTSVFQDQNQNYWFTTLESGVFYTPQLSAESLSDEVENSIIIESQVTALKRGEESLFFSNAKGQIIKIGQHGDGSLELIAQEIRDFKDLHIHGDDYYSSSKLTAITDNEKEIATAKFKDRITIGTVDYYLIFDIEIQVYSIDNANKKKEKLYKVDKSAWSHKTMLLTEELNFYSGNNHRLYFYEKESKNWTQIKGSGRLNSIIDVVSITPFKSDSVWVASRNRGVLLVYKDTIVLELNRNTGYPFDFCTHLNYDSIGLLVSTNDGVFKLNHSLKPSTSVQLTKNNGLLSNEIISTLRVGHKLYLATNEGLCRIDTSLFSSVSETPNCLIEEVRVGVDKKDKSKFLELPYSSAELRISYVANSFENALNIPYRYRIKASDKWTYTNDAQVILSNLNPATYKFEIQAANANGVWGESESFHFEVEMPFWKSEWFLAIAICITILIVSMFSRFRMQEIKKVSRLQNALVQSKNQALSSQMNPHFIFNSLNSITYGLLEKDMRSTILYIGKFGKLMRTIFENSEETFITLEEEVQALKNYLELEKIRLQEKLTYLINIDDAIDQFYIPALLLQPFVENAIWHGIAPLKENGKIWISVKKRGEKMEITIEDNGVGLKEKSLKKREKEKSAMQNAKKRLNLIERIYKSKIKFSIETIQSDTKSTGTRVILIVPLINSKPIHR